MFFTVQIHAYAIIGEIALHIGILLSLGGGVGFLSGVLGGGSFMTSLVTIFAVPPSVAVATKPSQIVAESMSVVLPQLPCDNHCCIL